ncbi:unnamed protein product [Camellia sinensis]
MSFLKTFRAILGLSITEDQLTVRHRNTPIPGGLTLISAATGIESPSMILQSVAVKPTASVSDGEMPTAGDITAIGTEVDSRSSVERFATMTESIGFESLNERAKCGELKEESSPTTTTELMARARSRETMRRVRLRNFPPFLSILNRNGRLRFNLSKVREDGRLQIIQVRNDWPEFVRSSPRAGQLLIIDAHHQEEDEEDEAYSNEEEESEDGRGGGVSAAYGGGLRWCEGRRR